MSEAQNGISLVLLSVLVGILGHRRAERWKHEAEALQADLRKERQRAEDVFTEADRQIATYRQFSEHSVAMLQV